MSSIWNKFFDGSGGDDKQPKRQQTATTTTPPQRLHSNAAVHLLLPMPVPLLRPLAVVPAQVERIMRKHEVRVTDSGDAKNEAQLFKVKQHKKILTRDGAMAHMKCVPFIFLSEPLKTTLIPFMALTSP